MPTATDLIEPPAGLSRIANGRPHPAAMLHDAVPEPSFAALARQEPDAIMPALVEYAAALRASDLYCYSNETDFQFAIRHLGIVRTLGSVGIEVGRRCVLYVKAMANMNTGERRKPLEGRWVFPRASGRPLDLRISTIPTLHGEDITLRILDQGRAILSLDQLGMHPHKFAQFGQMLTSPSGLILVCGPTESGKTTSMYAGLAYLNNGFRKINTIEDPIEYSLAGIRQSQIAATADVTFDVLLRGVLRQAPDVIMIGEIRDEETALIAVRAAATGHLVLSTLHAPVAAAAVHSMFRLGVQPRALSHALLGVVSQRLLRTLCPECKRAYPLPPGKAFNSVRKWMDPDANVTLYGPEGCPACHMTGFAGRTGLFEVLSMTPAVRTLMEHGAHTAAIRKQAVEDGMMEFRHAALLKVAQARTSLEEVTRVVPAEFLSAASDNG
ncbi:GspE/PulE family protein [Limnoglobus roseus]|uniref:General secretion pathway protein E n=1 Tax=Limnoglobus roseus TaxID=2598579 RepID=A0A5C1AI87_9BACT|nr:GspE/PulE family protein [Limnoglobus roseus]QEL18365.1 general secretion pathway protein E [Limnoglobus roseus]